MAAKPPLTLSLQQARLLHLAAQGLLARPRRRARKPDVLAAIAAMQLLQIDTIHVVARSPYLVLFSRLGAYDPGWLDAHLDAAAIFECWAHEACFAAARDLALHRACLAERAHHWAMKLAQRTQLAHRASMDRLLAHVREVGPVKAADFERTTRASSSWWGWKDEKRWLEACFALGELMVTRRDNFHRVYDLSERVLARATPALRGDLPGREDVRRDLVLRSVQALGLTQARWISDYFRTPRKHRDVDLQPFVDAGDLSRVAVRGWDAPGYVHRDLLPLARRAARGELRATHTTLLSPFDPVVWDRARARALFDFDYTLECYVPEPRRRYGYYVLPILRRGRLVGRLDAKAHRGERRFEVRSIHLEPHARPTAALVADVAAAIAACARWHDTPEVVVRTSDPRPFARSLRAALV